MTSTMTGLSLQDPPPLTDLRKSCPWLLLSLSTTRDRPQPQATKLRTKSEKKNHNRKVYLMLMIPERFINFLPLPLLRPLFSSFTGILLFAYHTFLTLNIPHHLCNSNYVHQRIESWKKKRIQQFLNGLEREILLLFATYHFSQKISSLLSFAIQTTSRLFVKSTTTASKKYDVRKPPRIMENMYVVFFIIFDMYILTKNDLSIGT
jgi:hypothetical protein